MFLATSTASGILRTSSGDVFAAISDLWRATPSLQVYNGPYRSRKPANLAVKFPYVIFLDAGNSRTERTSRSEYWQHAFSFVVRDTSFDAVEYDVGNIGRIFDDCELLLPRLVVDRDTGDHEQESGMSSQSSQSFSEISSDEGGQEQFVSVGHILSLDRIGEHYVQEDPAGAVVAGTLTYRAVRSKPRIRVKSQIYNEEYAESSGSSKL